MVGSPSSEKLSSGGGANQGDHERGISEVGRKSGEWCHKSQERLAFQGKRGHSWEMLPTDEVK